MLLKAKKPYGIKPNRNITLRTTKSNVKLGQLPIKDDFYMAIIMNTQYVDTGEEHSAYGIITDYTSKEKFENDNIMEYSKETSLFYQCPSYEQSLKELKNKIKKWSNNNLLIAKVLVSMAASSPEHSFWCYENPGDLVDGTTYQPIFEM